MNDEMNFARVILDTQMRTVTKLNELNAHVTSLEEYVNQLRAENERLRTALMEVIRRYEAEDGQGRYQAAKRIGMMECADIARRALEEESTDA